MKDLDFSPWAEHIRGFPERRWVMSIFAKLSMRGFVCQNPDAIDGGYRLEFQREECWVIVDRYASFQVNGERLGVSVYHDSKSSEFSFNSYCPSQMFSDALDMILHENE